MLKQMLKPFKRTLGCSSIVIQISAPFMQWIYVSLSVIVLESVPGAKSCGQPIWLELGTEVGYNEIFQKPLWLTYLSFSFGVKGGSHFLPFEHQKSSLTGGILKV